MMRTRRNVLNMISVLGIAIAGCLNGEPKSNSPAQPADSDSLSAPFWGASEPSVVIRVWEDFACPHCREFNHRVVPELRNRYVSSKTVRYEHHDFPIPVTKWSWPTALAARSVQATTGIEAFWNFAECVYDDQTVLDWSVIRNCARQAGADPEVVTTQARQKRWRPVVAADKDAGRERGVEGTPTVFVDDRKVPFGRSWETFRHNIVEEVKQHVND